MHAHAFRTWHGGWVGVAKRKSKKNEINFVLSHSFFYTFVFMHTTCIVLTYMKYIYISFTRLYLFCRKISIWKLNFHFAKRYEKKACQKKKVPIFRMMHEFLHMRVFTFNAIYILHVFSVLFCGGERLYETILFFLHIHIHRSCFE